MTKCNQSFVERRL